MERQSHQSAFEIWGGIECTLNRVGNRYFDQLERTGHYKRSDDIERLASLGIKKLRYPVLWEKHETEPGGVIDWSWAQKQLNAIRNQGIDAIVGLLHHGSGPAWTNLGDPLFPEKLAAYAGRVVRQFPWVENYTPVNEPLTTARFSGLYGFWFPHEREDVQFVRMLLNQVKAIVLSMAEIRKVRANAKLIQTEDLGKTWAHPSLQYQADFENERRWLTYDLLCGKVDRSHPLWSYFQWLGIHEDEITFFLENPCPPDIAGFNYYVTSERYLDPNIENYAEHMWGGNHKHRYVDTEAIRIRSCVDCGLHQRLMEAHERLSLPLAVTEAFLSCDQEDQARWLRYVFSQTQMAVARGADVRALTFWALLGEYGWNNLVTSDEGAEYEPGAFDVREAQPVETLSASFIRSVANANSLNDEWILKQGWWQRDDRYHVHELCLERSL